MIVLTHEQRSPEWFEARLGKLTGSRAKRISTTNNLPLVDELIAELLTGVQEETYTTAEMQRGTDLEPIACAEYEKVTGYTVEHTGLCVHPHFDFIAVSPDGWTNDRRGAVEIKSPKSSTHIRYIRQAQIPAEYRYQVLHYFLVNEALEWLDFVSYDPRVKGYSLFLERVTREELTSEIDDYRVEVYKFYDKFQKYYNKIKK